MEKDGKSSNTKTNNYRHRPEVDGSFKRTTQKGMKGQADRDRSLNTSWRISRYR